MKFRVHMLAFGSDNEVREVDVPDAVVLRERDSLESLLGLVYYYGQNDTQPQDHCSVSIGDVIEMPDGKYYRVDSTGFSRLAPDVLQTYKNTPRRDRDLVATWGERIY